MTGSLFLVCLGDDVVRFLDLKTVSLFQKTSTVQYMCRKVGLRSGRFTSSQYVKPALCLRILAMVPSELPNKNPCNSP